MKDIKIKINKNTRDVVANKFFIGNDGENLQGNIIFSFDEFVNGQARLEYEIDGIKNYQILQKDELTYKIPIKNTITKEGKIGMQLIVTEGTSENEIPKFKSNIFYLQCNKSINAEIEQPDGYELWIEQANTKLNQMDNLDIDIQDSVVTITRKDGTTKVENVKGDKGEKGDPGSIKFKITNVLPNSEIKWDGVSTGKEIMSIDFDTLYKVSDLVPTEEQLIGGTYKITSASGVTEYQTEITYVTSDKNVFKVTSGINNYIAVIKQSTEEYPQSPGIYFYYDGWGPTYTSSLSVILFEEIDEEAIYMIPSNGSEDNSYEEYIYVNDDWEKIGTAKVEVNLDNYVKFTDYANNVKGGVVKLSSSYGIWKFSSGAIYISAATETMIDAKTNNYCPIVPKNLDYAVKSVVGGHVTLTQEEYDRYFEPDENTYYYIVEE